MVHVTFTTTTDSCRRCRAAVDNGAVVFFLEGVSLLVEAVNACHRGQDAEAVRGGCQPGGRHVDSYAEEETILYLP